MIIYGPYDGLVGATVLASNYLGLLKAGEGTSGIVEEVSEDSVKVDGDWYRYVDDGKHPFYCDPEDARVRALIGKRVQFTDFFVSAPTKGTLAGIDPETTSHPFIDSENNTNWRFVREIPASEQWNKGDAVIDKNGVVWKIVSVSKNGENLQLASSMNVTLKKLEEMCGR